ncbi:hypothetical protein LN650_03270 [Klebsiella pneumoniae subsp. pneumoniae]|nr:hypothetical protein [Klebsiella pneumoniae subsp. pneumoniae]
MPRVRSVPRHHSADPQPGGRVADRLIEGGKQEALLHRHQRRYRSAVHASSRTKTAAATGRSLTSATRITKRVSKSWREMLLAAC